MTVFLCKFVKPSTGRINTKRFDAYDEADAREMVAAEGIEPVELSALPPRPATEAQIAYATSLGAQLPENLTIDEASSLIDNALQRREPADDLPRQVAARLKVGIDRYASKDKIYRLILNALQQRSSIDVASWYTYRVYRDGHDRSREGLIDPLDARFSLIGQKILDNEQAARSLRRAALSTPTAFRWFGSFTGGDGWQHTGDSRQTQAYQLARAELVNIGLLPAKVATTRRFPERPAVQQQPPRSHDPVQTILLFLGVVCVAVIIAISIA